MNFLYLALAIVFEVIGTTALKSSLGFTRLWPTLTVFGGYVLSFYLLSLALRTIPMGVAYALWSGVGIVLIALVGLVVHGERPDLPALIGFALIISGVFVINVFSRTVVH